MLRLACLMQDREAQNLKQTILSIIYEILYENNNRELFADELFIKTNDKFSTTIERSLFDELLVKSDFFEISNNTRDRLVKLTSKKFAEIDSSIAEFSIEPHIERFLKEKNITNVDKQAFVNILFNSIYENIYTFTPDKISSLIPNSCLRTYTTTEIKAFNDFLDFEDANKNRCLYNQFAKAIEFAILTSGQGVKQFSENLYKDKYYLLDTNIILRLLGVGGEERQRTIKQLLTDCKKQGIYFEYTNQTYIELMHTIAASVEHLQQVEKSQRLDILTELYRNNPNSFYIDSDFINHYCQLRVENRVNTPEQYELQMKAEFKVIQQEIGLLEADTTIEVNASRKNNLASKLMRSGKTENQAKVDSHNILYVKGRRKNNNYNYSDVKSFYLTTDRGLNQELSLDRDNEVSPTILPSQLFVIHHPLSGNSSLEPDYDIFFKFLKRRTSEFKFRGKDVLNYIESARTYTTDPKKIAPLLEAYADQRYTYSNNDAKIESEVVTFEKFAQTYFDQQSAELGEAKKRDDQMQEYGNNELANSIKKSRYIALAFDIVVTVIVIPAIGISLKISTSLDTSTILTATIVAEVIKFLISNRTGVLKSIWKSAFQRFAKNTSYFKIRKELSFIDKGICIIQNAPDNIWKYK